ncbi:MAG: glycoside hydrolase family 65 protein [Actinomycetes bacterium]
MTQWLLGYRGFDAVEEPVREVLCALGNGRFATRGAAAESRADGVHYPGTYAAGVFDRLGVDHDGHHTEHESMVNLPAWHSLSFRHDDGDWFSISSDTVTDYVQELDMRRGVLTRRFVVEDASGRRTAVAQHRIVSMADSFAAAQDSTFVAENWSGRLVVRVGLDGCVGNRGVARYIGLGETHLRVIGMTDCGARSVALDVETVESRLRVSLAARHRLLVDGQVRQGCWQTVRTPDFIGHDVELDLLEQEPQTVEKVVVLYTSRDRAVGDPAETVRRRIATLPDMDDLLARHVLAWDHLWERCYVEIDAPLDVVRGLHLHLFHLLQTVSQHSIDLDVGIPARGLHGEAYRGHIFWDDVFVFPFLNLRMPELARALLLYRWRRLPRAREAAREAGFEGAMFPWQSGSDGREETPLWHLNPKSGRWLRDNSRLQRHIGLAIAHNVWEFYEATGDLDFLAQHGAELMLEIAKFWAGVATYNQADDRYDICGVMGPDEYHDAYPWRDEPGLDNNTYTNVMVVWTLLRTLTCLELLPDRRRQELLDLLDIRREDLERWRHITLKMRVCWLADDVLAQFEGYDRLEEFPWLDYVERYADISRLDRILEEEGDTPNRFKLSKQADVLMLFYLLSEDELGEILDQLGYPHSDQMFANTVDYYRRRTSHGSTLSRIVHAWVLARSDRPAAWGFFREALDADIAGGAGGTTAEGIHLGAMAGTVDLLQRGFTGMQPRGDRLHLDPCLPDELTGMRFRMHYRQHHGVVVDVNHAHLVIRGHREAVQPLRLQVCGDEYEVRTDGALEVPLPPHRAQ